MLNSENISECQKRFSLSYHITFANYCEQLIGFKGKDVLEVGGSLPQEFVLEWLNVKSWSAIETPEYDKAFSDLVILDGEEFDLQATIAKIEKQKKLGFKNRKFDQYNLFLGEIENLPEEHYQKYDLIFSIAAFEHIHKIPQALEKMFAALRPGGKLFSMFCPIWSAHDGHHIPAVTDSHGVLIERGSSNCPIPPWGHLTMSPPEMCEHLYQHTDKKTADLPVYYIYNSDHINRFFLEDYLNFVQQSSFSIEKVERIYPTSENIEIQETLKYLYPKNEDFLSNGLMLILSKPLLTSNIGDESNELVTF